MPLGGGKILKYNELDNNNLEKLQDMTQKFAQTSVMNGKSNRSLCRICVLFLLLFTVSASYGQVVALKTNLLYDATATPDIELEFKVADRWTLVAGAGLNAWNPLKSKDVDNALPKWRHVLANMQAKYWFCSVFVRDFIGIDALYSHYNMAGDGYPAGWASKCVLPFGGKPDGASKGLEGTRKQGDLVAGGVFYGWSFILSPHISLELLAGADVGYTWYEEFDCEHCGASHGSYESWLLMPKFGLNFIWQIK